MRSPGRVLSVLSLLLLTAAAQAAPPAFHALAGARATTGPRPAGAASGDRTPAAVVSGVDELRGVPSFLWAARAASEEPGPRAQGLGPGEAARFHIDQHAARYGLSPESLASAFVARVHDTGRGGIVVVLRQRHGGVEVLDTSVKVLMDRELRLVAVGGALHPATPGDEGFRQAPVDVLSLALADLTGVALPAAAFVDEGPGRAGDTQFRLAGGVTELRLGGPARVKKVYFPWPDRLAAAYEIEVQARGPGARSDEAFRYVIDAADGAVLLRANLTVEGAFQYRVWADASGDHRPTDGPRADFTPHPTGLPDGSAPPFVAPSLISQGGFNQPADPWLAPDATDSRGNNVDAYTDDDSPDGFSAGDIRATVTAPGVFDRSYDLEQPPTVSDDQRMAAITQAFYTTNWLHDWWYDSGFTESAANAQASNLGRGGVEGDALHVEVQNGAPGLRNNANMQALADGASPRMQVFVWDGTHSRSLTILPANQTLDTGVAVFGPMNFDVTGAIVPVDDGVANVTDGCDPLVNAASVAGQIALVDRGQCTFRQKVVNAQNAGAIGVILVDNQASATPPTMGDGTPATPVTTPVLSITLAAGTALKAQLAQGAVTAALSRHSQADRDGALDNTIVAHEWGHYNHLRHVVCTSNECGAQGEGWGDFFALHLVLRENDDLDGTFALAQYATEGGGGDSAYFGIRRYPYSVNMARNPLTFRHIGAGVALPVGPPLSPSLVGSPNAEVHNAGEVWAQMMQECLVALLKRSREPGAPYSFEGARRRLGDYVEVGMTMAPANPTYTEQRDGILAAALAADPADFDLLARAFARRGAGSCAVSPTRFSTDLTGVIEDFTTTPDLRIVAVTLDDSLVSCDQDGLLDAGESGQLSVTVMNGGLSTFSAGTVGVSSGTVGVSFPGSNALSFAGIAPFTTATATVPIRLDPSIVGQRLLDLVLDPGNNSPCQPPSLVHATPLVNADVLPASSATDAVEAPTTTWTPTGPGASALWRRVELTPGNHAWTAIDKDSPSDTALLSPPLPVSPTDELVVSFDHRYSFEQSSGTSWDGGVIEVSTDDGGTWTDLSAYGDPGYTGKLGSDQAKNVLNGRQGYGGRNKSWPSMDTVTIHLGTKLAGQTLRLRFRVGTDDATGDTGWAIDNIAFQGITSRPFAQIVDDVCEPPVGGAGGAAGMGGAGAAGLGGAGGSAAGGQGGAGQGGAAGLAGSEAAGGNAAGGDAGTAGSGPGGGGNAGASGGGNTGAAGSGNAGENAGGQAGSQAGGAGGSGNAGGQAGDGGQAAAAGQGNAGSGEAGGGSGGASGGSGGKAGNGNAGGNAGNGNAGGKAGSGNAGGKAGSGQAGKGGQAGSAGKGGMAAGGAGTAGQGGATGGQGGQGGASGGAGKDGTAGLSAKGGAGSGPVAQGGAGQSAGGAAAGAVEDTAHDEPEGGGCGVAPAGPSGAAPLPWVGLGLIAALWRRRGRGDTEG